MLTDQERKFCMQYLLGMTAVQAARNAGFDKPEQAGRKLLKDPRIDEFLRAESEKYRDAAGVSREEIVEGMREAIDIAKTLSEPQTMILGYRELAKLCGLYAPEVKKIEVNVDGNVTVQQLEQMSDDELVKLIRQPALIEGEATHVAE